MIKQSIKVFAPATVSNVSSGFDIFGFAIDEPGDEVIVSLAEGEGEITISDIKGDGGLLPKAPEKNTAGVVVKAYLEQMGYNQSIDIKIHKKMPLGSGLGSSAASAAASILALNTLFDEPLTRRDLLVFLLQAERIACGAAHADNVAPALLGGFVLIRSYDPLDVIRIKTPKNLFCAVIHPHMEIRTEEARSILNSTVPLEAMVQQTANAAGLIAGFLEDDFDLIRRSLEDVVIEPQRVGLIPGFKKNQEIALQSGALGCGISGSGPSVFALCKGKQDAMIVGDAIKAEFLKGGLESDLYISEVNQKGARVI